jgi:putative ABC transport system permease protein
MTSLLQDVRYGLRTLLKTPGFTVVCVVTLALGIGANAAIFSVLNAFLFRPLPVKDPERLVVMATQHESNPQPHSVSYLDYADYRAKTDVFEDMAAYTIGFVGMSTGGSAERMTVSYVTGNYFTFLGLEPKLGRLIQPGEGEKPGTDPVLVLGHSYWKRHFGGDPTVVGRSVNVNGEPYTIIGVAPERFRGTYAFADMEGFLPLSAGVHEDPGLLTKRENHSMHTLARLEPGVTMEQAAAAIGVLDRQLEAQYPESNKTVTHRLIPELRARPEENNVDILPFVGAVFMGLVGLVLLVACVNVTNLLLVRATARHRELAVRAALGAGRRRLIQQLLTESMLLALLGGVGGLLLGAWVCDLLGSIRLPGDLPFVFDFGVDWRVFAYAMGVAILTGGIVGVAPALRASRSNLGETLRDGSRSVTSGARRLRLRSVLVVSQVAVSLVLMVSAGLFVRSLSAARQMDLGFRADHVLDLNMDPAQIGYDETRGRAFYAEVSRRVRALPGVESASFAYSMPMGYYNQGEAVEAEGQNLAPGDQGLSAGNNSVDAAYFDTLKIPILRGRAVTETDDAKATRVAVINEALAQKLWPGKDPLGKRFRTRSKPDMWIEVVGLTRTGKYGFLLEDPRPYYYLPLEQNYTSLRVLHVRTSMPPHALASAVRNVIGQVDTSLPVYDVISLEESLEGGNGFFIPRMGAAFAGALGLLGLALALIGVYGVVSYSASQRTQEFGIRLALGAQRRDISGLVLGRGLAMTACGVGLGLVAALGLGRLLQSLLYGVSAMDPTTYAGAALALGAAALLASYLPARRATRVDPIVALRHE